ncbi:unnamed protein product, partial [Polarella glacialis]
DLPIASRGFHHAPADKGRSSCGGSSSYGGSCSSSSSFGLNSGSIRGNSLVKFRPPNWPTWPPGSHAAKALPSAHCVLAVRFLSSSSVHEILANGDIPFPLVRVVDDNGLVGDFKLGEALAIARQRSTDLVVLSGEVQPPLCRLVGLSIYIEELDRKAAAQEGQKRERRLREFSFDPALKVKGMRFTALVDEHDLERKVNQVRKFLEKGHRVEARIIQGRAVAEDVLDLGLRIIAEVRDIAKPEYFEESIRELQLAVNQPKSMKRRFSLSAPDELRVRLWPCSPEQAASFQLPAHIMGPRRRKGATIIGIDDPEIDELAWKENRKPHTRKKGFTKVDLERATFDD